MNGVDLRDSYEASRSGRRAHQDRCDVEPGSPMPSAELDYSIQEGVLRIHIQGTLDLRCAFSLLLIVQAVDDSIHNCILDVSGVGPVFDSGLAALVLAVETLTERGVENIRIQGLDLDSATLRPFLM